MIWALLSKQSSLQLRVNVRKSTVAWWRHVCKWASFTVFKTLFTPLVRAVECQSRQVHFVIDSERAWNVIRTAHARVCACVIAAAAAAFKCHVMRNADEKPETLIVTSRTSTNTRAGAGANARLITQITNHGFTLAIFTRVHAYAADDDHCRPLHRHQRSHNSVWCHRGGSDCSSVFSLFFSLLPTAVFPRKFSGSKPTRRRHHHHHRRICCSVLCRHVCSEAELLSRQQQPAATIHRNCAFFSRFRFFSAFSVFRCNFCVNWPCCVRLNSEL